MQFTEAASQTDDVASLADLALRTLQQVLPGSSGAFYTRTEVDWTPLRWTADFPPDLLAVLRRGLPLDTPLFTNLREADAPIFLNDWCAAHPAGEEQRPFHAVAAYPVHQQGELCAVLGIALQDVPAWTPEREALVRALGRSFALLYDRVSAAEQLHRQRTLAEGREHILSVLARLTADFTTAQDDYALIEQVQAEVLRLLPPGHAAYWEQDGALWRLRAHVNDVGHPDLMTLMRAGMPAGATPTLDVPWTTGRPLYQNAYPGGRDVAAEMTTHIHAIASLPIGHSGARRGVINFTTFAPYQWNRVDQALLETLAQGLWLAMERASHLRQLEEERASLAAFAAFTEAVGTERDSLRLAQQAVTLLTTTLPGLSVAFYVRSGPQWVARVWSEDIDPGLLTQLQAGVSATAPDFARAVDSGEVVFADDWDAAGNDLPGADMYSTAAFVPLVVDGQTQQLLATGVRARRSFSERERGIIRAVGQGLALALERATSMTTLAARTAQVERANQDLDALNEELESFMYSASHDLRTPVRHAQGFVDVTLRALEQGQVQKAQQKLTVVKDATGRLAGMIDAMLTLSRTGRQPLHLSACALDPLVRRAQQDAHLQFPHQEVQWDIGPLPTVLGDRALLQQVLTHLISNAVKFSQGAAPARVTVRADTSGGADPRGGQVTVSVQDQGIGFNMAYAARLFGLFQRLHTQQDFAGAGAGLATVKRIVMRHGGRVWAHSEVGQGATFSFTLPLAESGSSEG
ncbi:ATP-binding protein [Deinococcus radiotolerans]|uniref:histidine kinase n=1 Tax=Deinococcus radiotolerans TaxID=1309407 RepID=A0ABQ2FHQ0_9DEIO|nr:ATP-binding protein [Deinococcus radiotolerans]GGK99653.1 hypothetical protein GCM10010844_17440 [Deinococcus radiotolerans]